MSLIRIEQRIEDSFYSVDRVSNNNDVLNIWSVDGLINSISDNKQLSLSSGNIDSSINSLDNRLIVQVNMGHWSNNTILDAYI